MWKNLFSIASFLSWGTLLMIPVQLCIFVVSPPPSEVADIFLNLKNNLFLGLCNLDLLYLLTVVTMGYLYLAFYVSLKKQAPVMALSGLFLGTLGIAAYFSSTVLVEMAQLSADYFSAGSLKEQTELLLVGKTILTRYMGTAFTAYYVLNAIALLLFTIPMISNPLYRKTTGQWGVAAALLMLVPSNFGMIGMIFSILSLLPTSVWLVLTAQDLKRCSKLQLT